MTWGGLGGPLSAIAGWLLTYALHSTILLICVWTITRVVRAPQWRDFLWKLGLTGGLVTATLQTLLGFQPFLAHLPLYQVALGSKLSLLLHPTAVWLRSPATTLGVVGVWLIGALVGVSSLWQARRRLHRALSHRAPVDHPKLVGMMRELSARAGLRKPVRLSTLAPLAGPITISRHETCVPARTLHLDDAQLRSVLAHEVAHAKRRDTTLFQWSLLLERIFFFQPLLRTSRHEIRDAAEFLCDTWAAEQVDQVTVARSILEVASWRVDDWDSDAPVGRPTPLLLPTLMQSKTALGRRIRRLIEGPRTPEMAMWRQWCAAILVWVAMILAAPTVITWADTPLDSQSNPPAGADLR